MTVDLEPRSATDQGKPLPAPHPIGPLYLPTPHLHRPWYAARPVAAVALLVAGLLVGLIVAPRQPAVRSVIIPRPAEVASAAAAVAPSVVQIEAATGLGSGVIYSADGLILTAAHVVEGSSTVDIRLPDGRLMVGNVIGTHGPTDIAVISIEAENLTPAVLGYRFATRVGEIAVAVGSPFGLDQTVTAGIVSSTGRNINGVPMIQTDAAINPGNSGGPLVNGAGHVIGINDVIFTEGGGNVGIVVAEQLVAGGEIELSALGAATVPDTSGDGGAIVREVIPDSPAAVAGLQIGDRIISLDGQPVLDPSDLFAAVITHRPGSSVEVEFSRNGPTRRVSTTLVGIER